MTGGQSSVRGLHYSRLNIRRVVAPPYDVDVLDEHKTNMAVRVLGIRRLDIYGTTPQS